jgi:hypothetical protein
MWLGPGRPEESNASKVSDLRSLRRTIRVKLLKGAESVAF